MRKRFEADLKKVFDAEVDQIDEATRTQLAARRRQALTPRRNRFIRPATLLPIGALAAAAVAVLIVQPPGTALPGAVAEQDDLDLEILLAEENFELLEDLEFFQWLSTVEDAG